MGLVVAALRPSWVTLVPVIVLTLDVRVFLVGGIGFFVLGVPSIPLIGVVAAIFLDILVFPVALTCVVTLVLMGVLAIPAI
jgi:hypothetical protein